MHSRISEHFFKGRVPKAIVDKYVVEKWDKENEAQDRGNYYEEQHANL